uniref:Uncharacterized protein n=1 Tax=Pseudo-nitzschia arenysensis TaxID=697910 RepID=A0A7S0F7M0_9STRA|mmetsp:Transcript_685/g.1653  ORF Transcript_685/g.1653 Transcript_685/m.1653 type:complete len:455 (+) Transcript_685:139-1503(+)|eukprot:CAMPEP_0116143502 /NCGR_PEP_ID=MMETSP0329-20121206/15487_1 /TAXON_ID=697910 /ORGANISM="Pseudo-nitzschia arenysensis, Strain B593" /LENGTH=454 /DNA_ID=CAMNT_0003638831 /DNA_START=50 /DNA_END=1414 /DNA_ORIENTATION=+
MEFHKPKRLLGLFGKRYSTSAGSTTKRPSKVEDDHSQPDLGKSSSCSSEEDLTLIRLTSQRDVLLEELRLTKETLEKEKKTSHDLNQRLIMKAISIDCQLAETDERFAESRAKIEAATQNNKEMSDKLLATRMENQNLMKRTAALARRDQIQKATIMASNTEIIKLMTTIEAFQERYLTLHDSIETHKQKYMKETEKEVLPSGDEKVPDDDIQNGTEPLNTSSSEDSVTPFERDQMTLSQKDDMSYAAKVKEFEAKLEAFNAKREELEAKQKDHHAKEKAWHTERDDLFACIAILKSNNKQIKKKFVQTLKKHQWKWHKEKEKLLKKVGDLEVWLEEKDAELEATKNALVDAIKAECGIEKGGIQKTDTFSTLDTQDEDSLSTCSSTSLSIAYSLTETSNNLSKNGEDDETTLSSVFEPLVIKPSKSFSELSTQCLDTPPRSNGSNTTDQSSLS